MEITALRAHSCSADGPIRIARLEIPHKLVFMKCGLTLFGITITCLIPTSWSQSPEEAEGTLLDNVRQVTFAGKRAGEGYYSADGSKLVFQSERDAENPFFQIFVMDLETGDVEKVSQGHGKTTCAWMHPKGEKVLYASTHEDPKAREKQKEELKFRESGKERRYSWDYDQTYDIFASSLDGKTITNLKGREGMMPKAVTPPMANGSPLPRTDTPTPRSSPRKRKRGSTSINHSSWKSIECARTAARSRG